jgi:hypothetical protein
MLQGSAVSSDDRDPPRPLASADRGRTGPFGALVAAASRDASAARSLALAYAEHPPETRLRLIDAIVADAMIEGADVATVLAPLLSVEGDPQVARAIAAAMCHHDGAGLAPATRPEALAAGDARVGAVVLTRPLYGDFVEILAAAWSADGGVTHVLVDPLAHPADVGARAADLPLDPALRPAPMDRAIDLLADALWHHKQRFGALPDGLERFADLFG